MERKSVVLSTLYCEAAGLTTYIRLASPISHGKIKTFGPLCTKSKRRERSTFVFLQIISASMTMVPSTVLETSAQDPMILNGGTSSRCDDGVVVEPWVATSKLPTRRLVVWIFIPKDSVSGGSGRAEGAINHLCTNNGSSVQSEQQHQQ